MTLDELLADHDRGLHFLVHGCGLTRLEATKRLAELVDEYTQPPGLPLTGQAGNPAPARDAPAATGPNGPPAVDATPVSVDRRRSHFLAYLRTAWWTVLAWRHARRNHVRPQWTEPPRINDQRQADLAEQSKGDG